MSKRITKKLIKETTRSYEKERDIILDNISRSFFELQKNIHCFTAFENKVFEDIEKDGTDCNFEYGEMVYNFTNRIKRGESINILLFYAMECITDYDKESKCQK